MKTLPFTIDSHLLQELGERLVGRPYIALAELVKNAYDADANYCEIVFSEDEIEVWDDGHGMTFDEFRDFWMRIGTTNKMEQRVSRKYGRLLTGSKGIGRLAVQFLARQVQIVTTSGMNDAKRVYAEVDWDAAIDAGELTRAVARYEVTERNEVYPKDSSIGTKIILRNLNHDWSAAPGDKDSPVRELAREVWMLQPPFADAIDELEEGPDVFRIDLVSIDEWMEDEFRSQLEGVLEVWDAKIQGEIRGGKATKRCDIVVGFRDGDKFEISTPLLKGQIDHCDFEIRIFKLYGKQPGKIGVEEARTYFKEFGGVHVYDGGFRLPYYGIEHDWLGIESDHAHRLSISRLLPDELNVPLAMHDLPTSERIFGVVNINTTRELQRASAARRKKGNHLKINIGRDRLVDNAAYQELRRVVRWSTDYYATRYQLRQESEISHLRPTEPPGPKLDRLRQTIDEIEAELPPELHAKLVEEIDDYYVTVENQTQYTERQIALLAPLAAAGLASLAFEHESNREIRRLARIVDALPELVGDPNGEDPEVQELVTDFTSWIDRNRRMRSLFSPLSNEIDREDVRRLHAKRTVRIVLRNTRWLLRNISADLSNIPEDLRLPMGTMADWQALFQNVFVNAANAMLDTELKRLRISGGKLRRRRKYIQVSDTGVGVDADNAQKLFEPFVREMRISDERKSLGIGGMGLGLTIVRMICETRKCKYEFVDAEPGYSSTFRITWTK